MTVAEMTRINRRNGYHFFDKDTLEFWGTDFISPTDENGLFITRDDNSSRSQKLYTVRSFNEDTGETDTVSEFQQFTTLEQAEAFRNTYNNQEVK